MLAIKLQRIGKKHQPSYRIIVQEKREKLGGRSVEDLGWLNPNIDKFEVNKDRVTHWIKMGAQPTDTVHNLLVTAGVLTGSKIAVHGKAAPKAAAPAEAPVAKVEAAASAPAPEAKAEEAPKEESKPAA